MNISASTQPFFYQTRDILLAIGQPIIYDYTIMKLSDDIKISPELLDFIANAIHVVA